MSFVRPAVLSAACFAILVSGLVAATPAPAAPSRKRAPADPVRARAEWLRAARLGTLPAPEQIIPAGSRGNFLAENAWTPLAPAASAAWLDRGAAGFTASGIAQQGRATAVWVNPTAPAEIWAGFAGGGVWKTLNGGATWTPLSDKLASLSVGALTLDRTAGRTRVFLGTGEGNFTYDGTLGLGVYASLDNGATWTLSALPWDATKSYPHERNVHRIAIDQSSANGTTLYAAADGGLFKGALDTATGAINWGTGPLRGGGTIGVNDFPAAGISNCGSPTHYPLIAITDVAVDSTTTPATLYAAVGTPFDDPVCNLRHDARRNNGVYRSTDGGANFTRIRVTGTGNFTGVGTGVGVGRVQLALARPENSATPLPRRLAVIAHEVSTDGLDAVYFANNGLTATQTSGWTKYTSPDFLGTRGWFSLAIIADPAFIPANAAAPSRLFAGGLQLQLSNNSGQSWSPVSAAPAVYGGIHDAAFTDDGLTVVAATDGGIFRGAVSGNSVTWSNLNGGGLNTLQFFGLAVNPGAPAAMNGGAVDAGEARTAGAAWSAAACAGGCADGGRSLFTNATTAWGAGPYGALRRSVDGGANFACVRNFGGCSDCTPCIPDWQTAYIAPLAADGSGAVYLGGKRIYRYAAGVFTELPGDGDLVSTGFHYDTATVTAIAVAPSDPQVIYAGTSDGQVWRTLTGGATAASWTNISLATTAVLPASQSSTDAVARPVGALAVDPADPAKLVVVYGGYASQTATRPGHYFRSLNATSVSTTTPPEFVNLAPAGESDLPVHAALLLGATPDLFVGLERGVGRVADVFNGASARVFEDVTGNAPNAGYHALAATPAGLIRAASHGRGVWELDPALIRTGNAFPVADGRPVGGAPTQPLRIAKAGAQFSASWDVSGVCASTRYNLYAGPLTTAALSAGYTLSAAPVCNASAGSATFADPSAGQSLFFLATGTDGAATDATAARLSQDSGGAYRGSGAGFCAVTANAASATCN